LQVIAIGEEVKLPLKVGDIVTFQKYAMAEVGPGNRI
jgi:co-chaperonin GroES (HSP10)